MARCTKDEEIELSSERTIEVTIEVTGYLDTHWGADADGNRGESRWLVDSYDHALKNEDEELTEDEAAELKEKVEEIVFEEAWDFENAGDDDDQSDDE